MARHDERAYPLRSVSEEKRSQMALSRSTLWAAVFWAPDFVAPQSKILADILLPRFASGTKNLRRGIRKYL